MELFEEMLYRLTVKKGANSQQVVYQASYLALKEIKAVLDNDSLDDAECFWKIESIVRIFEKYGSDGGSRHDF